MSLPEGFTLRRATTADLDTLVDHRRAMFEDMGYTDHAAMSSMSGKFRPWLLAHMNACDYLAWLIDWPPHMIGKGARCANILNVYMCRDCRRRGLVRELMQAALAWCKENGVDTVVLHASPEARSLYEAMGFAAANEMRLQLESAP